ncbi:MAG: hypothetical protein NTW74_18625 [Acidobacteria bacterium]|nr:hypothetical protein [Acidobacteriota bacterium]
MKIALLVVAVLGVVLVLALLYGRSRWQGGTRQLRTAILAGQMKAEPSHYDSRELMGLPTPVRRYFESVLTDGQPMILKMEMEQEGSFNMGESAPQWKPFRASQLNVMRVMGFDWDATIAMMPGVPVFVHDAYVGGQGILQAELAGLYSLASISGSPEAAQGELMRFLAEGIWYPTRLLPSQGVKWEAMDERSARATLIDAGSRCSLEFYFGDDGYVERVRAAARYRTVGTKLEAAPWECRLWNYQMRDGMRVPLEGEVSWLLPSGVWPYWRGRVTQVRYEFMEK